MTLRVLHVIDSLGTGGAERSLAETLPRLEQYDVTSTVVYFRCAPQGIEAELAAHAIPLIHLEGSNRLSRILKLRRLLRQNCPDLIHTTLFESDLSGRIAAAGTGIPVLSSLVNIPYGPERRLDPRLRPHRLRLALWLDSWTARHLTTRFHAITEAVKSSAVTTLGIPSERITVIERGRDPERLGLRTPERRRRVRQTLGTPRNAEVVLNVGREEFQKGQETLLRATAKLTPHRPRLETWIAGRPGHASENLTELARELKIENRVRRFGFQDELPDLLAAADVFAFPSLFEGLGGSLLEAMALELPIVASDIPAIREIVRDGGFAHLVRPQEPHMLAAAIHDLLDHPERARAWGRRGRERFETRFTVDRQVEHTARLYRRVVESREDSA